MSGWPVRTSNPSTCFLSSTGIGQESQCSKPSKLDMRHLEAFVVLLLVTFGSSLTTAKGWSRSKPTKVLTKHLEATSKEVESQQQAKNGLRVSRAKREGSR
ncbi:hypothetical protein GQ600_11671 [Phytophthora cactorum]|nr:hypothetical protein GQ600_11671 [Phytophthora cactorum]